MKVGKNLSGGFALPTIIISAIIMLMMLLSALQSVVAIDNALTTQHYNKLASEAAESGDIYAENCLKQSVMVVTWTAEKPLKPNTDCNGNVQAGLSAYVIDQPDLKTTFSVPPPTLNGNTYALRVQGSANRIKASDSSIWSSYGQNVAVQIPNKTTVSAKNITGDDPYANQISGDLTNMFTSSDGSIYIWGNNTNQIYGVNASSIPTRLDLTGTLLGGKIIKQVVPLGLGSLFLTSDNQIYSLGWAGCVPLTTPGHFNVSQAAVPQLLQTVGTPMEGETIKQVSGGGSSCLALATDGSVYAWGENTFGELGNGTTIDSYGVPVAVQVAGTPMSGKTITQVSAGNGYNLALASDNTVYAWGDGLCGNLGNNSIRQGYSVSGCNSHIAYTDSSVPVAVQVAGTPMSGKTITQVSAGGGWTSMALDSNGVIYQWGCNGGPLPTPISTTGTPMEDKHIVQIANGGSFFLALSSDGTVYGWGGNTAGDLGNGTTVSSNVPTAVTTAGTPMEGKHIIQISVHEHGGLALASDGSLYSWGYNQYAQLGNGTTTNSLVPVAVTMPSIINSTGSLHF